MTPGRADARGPVYIGGLDRCGKTTMAAFLTSHPNIDVPGVGSNLWTYFAGRFGDLARPENLDRCVDALLGYKHVAYLQLDADRLRRDLAQGAPTYARLFDLVHRQHAERAGKPRYGDQTGLVERYADELFAAYPGVRVIHMVRDPRDRYEASLAAWPDGRGRAGGAAARWAYSTRLATRNARRHRGRYTIVRFEDLVAEPEATVRAVCAFVGEEFDDAMMDMPDAPERRARLLEHPAAAPGRLLTADVVGGFRGKLDPEELAFLQLQLGRLMRAHGYAPEPVALGTRGWAHFAVRTWPDQAVRMSTWRAREAMQQRIPNLVGRTVAGRRPAERMILRDPAHQRAGVA